MEMKLHGTNPTCLNRAEENLKALGYAVNRKDERFNLGDSIIRYAKLLSGLEEMDMLNFTVVGSREEAIEKLRTKKADVVVVLPVDL